MAIHQLSLRLREVEERITSIQAINWNRSVSINPEVKIRSYVAAMNEEVNPESNRLQKKMNLLGD